MSLVLASASSIRRDMLQAAGVAFEVRPGQVDEDVVKASHAGDAAELALRLAETKALAGPTARRSRERGNPDENEHGLDHRAFPARASRFCGNDGAGWVIGADSVVEAPDGALLSKPATREAAWDQLMRLRGATHRIVSAAALARDGAVVWRGVEEARLTVRAFSEDWLREYLDAEWEEIRWCVGGYRMEALGVQLFDRVEGSYHAVLGLPLLPLLGALRAEGALTA